MDPVSNMLTLIRNAQAVRKETVSMPFSELKYQIAKLLAKNGFLGGVEKKGRKTQKIIEITLKYDNGDPKIFGLKKVSKPGQRIYKKFREIRPVKGGYGLALISTSRGLMTNKEARKQKLGGEVICEIW
jgi:small subunit ribosomal protein S8